MGLEPELYSITILKTVLCRESLREVDELYTNDTLNAQLPNDRTASTA